jgi:hypothetical protein
VGVVRELLQNGGFELGNEPWQQTDSVGEPVIVGDALLPDNLAPRSGRYTALLGGESGQQNRLQQTIRVPADAVTLTATGHYWVHSYLEGQSPARPAHDIAQLNVMAGEELLVGIVYLTNLRPTGEEWRFFDVSFDATLLAGRTLDYVISGSIAETGEGLTSFAFDVLSLAAVADCQR